MAIAFSCNDFFLDKIMNDSICSKTFNSRIVENLLETGFRFADPLCVGVSGGADSICLLTSIAEGIEEKLALTSECQTINVITVDHKIRSEEESGGDCDFVKNCCIKLNERLNKVKVVCTIEELKKGQVMHTAELRKKGIEDAARFLRYQAFEKNAVSILNSLENKNVFFALAHNQNDQLETLIMRFLSGSGASSRGGILQKRLVKASNGTINYVRPLINVSRNEIENYLIKKEIPWRTDSTNADNNYLRNNIRNSIIPVLDQNVPGWKTAVLQGSEKALLENSFIEKSIEGLEWSKAEDGLFIEIKVFESLDFVQREHLLYKAFEQLETGTRIPFSFVKQIALEGISCSKYGIEAVFEDNKLWLKKQKNSVTIYEFFDIIEKEGLVSFEIGKLSVKTTETGFANLEFVTKDGRSHYLNNVPFPFVFRSRQLLDTVLTKSKGKKSVSDVLSDFKVKVEHKNLIPVIQSLADGDNNIIAIWGEVFGYSNWIV